VDHKELDSNKSDGRFIDGAMGLKLVGILKGTADDGPIGVEFVLPWLEGQGNWEPVDIWAGRNHPMMKI
jgi:hypothetical protein